MIKAKVTDSQHVYGHVFIKGIQLDAKGEHSDIVLELRTIIESFYEEENYRMELMTIMEDVVDKGIKELENIKKENK